MKTEITARILRQKARAAKPENDKLPYRVAILGYRSTQFLSKFIKEAGLIHGIRIECYEAGYKQVELAVLDKDSDLYSFDPQVILIVNSWGNLRNQFYESVPDEKFIFYEKVLGNLNLLCQTISRLSKAKILITNLEDIPDGIFGHFSNKTRASFPNQIRRINVGLMDLAESSGNIHILDVSAMAGILGAERFLDPGLYIHADIPYSLDIEAKIAWELAEILQVFSGKFSKCLILDLDHTIWGGVIGDDGLKGIELGSPGIGKAFTELQKWVKQLKDRGIILAVCSKNNEEIASEPFLKHKEMILRLEDIAVFMANWSNKADNIRHIREVLNIGFDSMVFLDDNPAERELIRTILPEVLVPELPPDPVHYLPYLSSLNLFETTTFSNQDRDRTNQYREEAKRRSFEQSFTNIDDFLRTLDMKGQMGPFQDINLPRIAQLSQRSNQFNLRTVRYSETDILQIQQNHQYLHYEVSLEDKFGKYGLISLVVMKQQGNQILFVENWLMSCRVLKRGVEKFVLNRLVQDAIARGFQRITGEYLPTEKNKLVANHYSELGFTENESRQWELVLSDFKPLPHFIIHEPD